MATVQRLAREGTRRGQRTLVLLADELREQRVALGLTQSDVASAIGVSRWVYSRIESGTDRSVGIVRAAQAATVLGLELSLRVYPGGAPLRDSAHAKRLERLLIHVSPPLTYRLEVPLPARPDGFIERRAWDALISGGGQRTGVELEMRLRDSQSLERRLQLKLRDDSVDQFLLLVADTRTNRSVLRSGVQLLGLPRLTIGQIFRALREGRHPPSAIVLI